MRQMPNFRRNALGRPHRWHRLYFLTLNFGVRFDFSINDFFARNGKIREDGRHVHDFYLLQVKKPEESKYPWDYYHVRQVIPANDAVMPVAQSECPLVKK